MIPSYNGEAEQSVLGCMILNNDKIADVVEIVSADDFYKDQNKQIFLAISMLNTKGVPADMVEVADHLTKTDMFDFVGGYDYLSKITSSIPTTENAIHYANILHECSQRRKLIKAGQNAIDAAQDNQDISDALNKAEKDILEINSHTGTNFKSAAEVAVEAMDILERRCKNKGKISGMPTGFKDLDFKLGGLQDGELYIIAGRPSMGKSALAEEISIYISCLKNQPTAFFSLEMSGSSLISRAFSSLGMVDNAKMKLGYVEDSDWKHIADAFNVIINGKLVIDDTAHIKASEIRSKCRRIKNKFGDLRLIVVDHLTEMWRPFKGDATGEHEENIRALRRIAKEMKCPLILLQQLNRKCEMRDNKRPMLSDLKETGAAEEVADVVMFIYRDDYYNPDSDKRNIAEVNIAKGRNVGTGTVELRWFGEYTKFANIRKDDVSANNHRQGYNQGQQRRKMPYDD